MERYILTIKHLLKGMKKRSQRIIMDQLLYRKPHILFLEITETIVKIAIIGEYYPKRTLLDVQF